VSVWYEGANLSRFLKKNMLCRETKSNNNVKDGWSTMSEKKQGHSVDCLEQLINNDVCKQRALLVARPDGNKGEQIFMGKLSLQHLAAWESWKKRE
jgi:hypothetical protein